MSVTKYNGVRQQIENGDIALFRGTHLLARTIQWGDAMPDLLGNMRKAYYNHCALIFKKGERLLTIDSVANGVQPHFLSHLMKGYIDFCIVRPTGFSGGQIDDAVNRATAKAEQGIKYDFWMLPRIGLYRRFGLDAKKLGSTDRDTCSEFTGRRYGAEILGINSYKDIVEKQNFISPQDHIRYASKQIQIKFDDRKLLKQK